jgi:hypothetical protein
MGAIRKKRKNPTTALVLSGIFPGLGQIFKGILFLALVVVICVLAYNPVIYLINSWGSFLNMTLDMSQIYKLLIYIVAANVVLVRQDKCWERRLKMNGYFGKNAFPP